MQEKNELRRCIKEESNGDEAPQRVKKDLIKGGELV